MGMVLRMRLGSHMRHAVVSASAVTLNTSRRHGYSRNAVPLLLLLLTLAGRLLLHIMLAHGILCMLGAHTVWLTRGVGLGLQLLICGKAREDAGRRIQVSLRLATPLLACWWLQQSHGAGC